MIKINGAVEISVWIAGEVTIGARFPIFLANLPQTNCIISTSLVNSIRISTTFSFHNTLAVGLVPSVFGTPTDDI